MKILAIAFGVSCTLIVLGCSKHYQESSSEISLHLLDASESSAMETALSDFALKNGFTQKMYSNHEKSDDSRPFTVEYQNPTIRQFNAIALDYAGKKAGGCLTISIVFHDEDVDLRSLLKDLNGVIQSNIHDSRIIYVDSECGHRSTAIE